MKNNEKDFEINLIGDRSNEKWLGTFVCNKILSHRQQLLEDQLYQEHLGKGFANASPRAREQAEILARIKVSLVKWPDWWKELGMGMDSVDDNLITEVWTAIMKIQLAAFEAIQNKAKEAEGQLKEIAASDQLK
jgi:hypothetical protein